MIKTAQDMIKALRRDTFCGVILYQGPSLIDGAPIVVIANRIVLESGNAKTGAMVQTFIIRRHHGARHNGKTVRGSRLTLAIVMCYAIWRSWKRPVYAGRFRFGVALGWRWGGIWGGCRRA